MVSDCPSLKFSVPHLGQNNMEKSVIWIINDTAMTKCNGLGLCHIRQNKYKSDKWETIASDFGDWKQ